jgi:hypothetical protein
MPAFKMGAMANQSPAFIHRSTECWGPDWGPLNLLISNIELNSIACVAYWLPFTH